MVLGKDGLGLFPYSVPLPIYIILFLLSSYSGPTFAALLITTAMEGKAGVKAFLRRYQIWRVGIQCYLIALLGYPLLYVIVGMFWLEVVPLQSFSQHWSVYFIVYLPGVLLLPGIITWGEEAGWRSFALTHMQHSYSALRASVVVGFFHGIWHLPLPAMAICHAVRRLSISDRSLRRVSFCCSLLNLFSCSCIRVR
jgi:membrane protease YdiL (CAAX protease family)